VLVADVYGKGVRPKDTTRRRAQVSKVYRRRRRRARARRRGVAAEGAGGQGPLDRPDRRVRLSASVASVLELARSGADIAGVVSSIGDLDSYRRAAQAHQGAVLVLNGADDARCRRRSPPSRRKWTRRRRLAVRRISAARVHCFTPSRKTLPTTPATAAVTTTRVRSERAFADARTPSSASAFARSRTASSAISDRGLTA
jgi:hypothetical protein